jgi:uncharacterized protein
MEEKILKNALSELEQHLSQHLKQHAPIMVAYSGGVDSALLAYLAHRSLNEQMLAVIADSPSLARREYRQAIEFTQKHSIPLKVIRTKELNEEGYLANAGDRCYYCKRSLFEKLNELQTKLYRDNKSNWAIAYGVNTDDLGDYRPGLKAAEEAQVYSPYLELEISKAQIRDLAKYLGLDIAEKPAMPCLSSRIPHGQRVDQNKLSQVEQAEDVLFDLGFKIFRVRHHNEIARIEVHPDELQQMITLKDKIEPILKNLGFHYIALDLGGFKSGSLNRELNLAN